MVRLFCEGTIFRESKSPDFFSPRPNHLATTIRLQLAESAFDAGFYDLAARKYLLILATDPDSEDATEGLQRVAEAKAHQYERHGEAGKTDSPSQSPDEGSPSEAETFLRRKLETVFIPFFEVYDIKLSAVLDLLRKDAMAYDTDPVFEQREIRIVLKIPNRPVFSEFDPTNGIPGLLPAAPMPDTYVSGDTILTLVAPHISLSEALSRVAAAMNMKLEIGPDALSLVPLSEDGSLLRTLEVLVPPSFVGLSPEQCSITRTFVPGAPDVSSFSLPDLHSFDVVAHMESHGMPFPPGARAVYLLETRKLVIRNTPANIDLLEAMAAEVDSFTPSTNRP